MARTAYTGFLSESKSPRTESSVAMNRTMKILRAEPALTAVSVFLLAYGLHDLLVAHVSFLAHSGLIDIQFALIQLQPPGVVHVAVTLLLPLLAIVAAIALFLKKKVGWWLAVVVSSFAGFTFLLAFVSSSYAREIMNGYVGSIPIVYADLIVRAVLFFACFAYLLRSSVLTLYFERQIKARRVAFAVLLGNIVFAMLVYRW